MLKYSEYCLFVYESIGYCRCSDCIGFWKSFMRLSLLIYSLLPCIFFLIFWGSLFIIVKKNHSACSQIYAVVFHPSLERIMFSFSETLILQREVRGRSRYSEPSWRALEQGGMSITGPWTWALQWKTLSQLPTQSQTANQGKSKLNKENERQINNHRWPELHFDGAYLDFKVEAGI